MCYPRHPAHLDPFVEELGAALAVRFLIAFAGNTLYFPTDPAGVPRRRGAGGP
ncbi:hypothetical protein [Maliponia aquimaris]|uniref:hypothetical protein n=1 Tax=Maliponia aquimaris TaxID=1673631 RepID=UPI0015963236|nr:hypothetical protein [Maliponia aquimaris]